eukprot:791739_1
MSRGYEMSILWRFRWNSETDTPKNFSFYYGHIEESYDWLSMKQGQNAAKTRDMNEKKVTKSYSVSFYGILSTFYGTKFETAASQPQLVHHPVHPLNTLKRILFWERKQFLYLKPISCCGYTNNTQQHIPLLQLDDAIFWFQKLVGFGRVDYAVSGL